MADKRSPILWLILAIAGLWLGFGAVGLGKVPFHPDETSMLYQTRDVELFIQNPAALAWKPDRAMTQSLEYRLLNAPLAKYMVGLARRAAGYTAEDVSTDWDWSLTWDENVKSGGLPPSRALLAGRAASLASLSLAGLALSLWGYRVGEWKLAILILLSFALNAFQLLHGRRAMAEGAVLAAVSLWLYASTQVQSKPWLLGVASGLSLASKHSTAPLLLVGFLAALIYPSLDERRPGRSLRSAAAFTFSAIALFFVLNPVFWANPIGGIREAIRLRSELADRQGRELDARQAGITLSSPVQRVAAAIGLLFITDIQFQEVGNYRDALQEDISSYQAVPGHGVDRGAIAGALRLTLFALGGILAARGIFGAGRSAPGMALILIGGVLQAGALIIFNPLPFQRYYAPLLPFVHALTAWAVYWPIVQIAGGNTKKTQPIESGETGPSPA